MPTFAELHQRQKVLSQKIQVLNHLVEHVDEQFRGAMGCLPKSKLLDDDKVPVPTEAFDAVVNEVLIAAANHYKTELDGILRADLTAAQPEAPKKHSKTKGEGK